MCHSYTFCQQNKKKLYSISYKTVISCLANISINPSLWCYSTVEKQNRNELKSQPSSFTSRRESQGIAVFTCESQRGKASHFSLERIVYLGNTGEQVAAPLFLRDDRSYSSPGEIPPSCKVNSKDAGFPKE